MATSGRLRSGRVGREDHVSRRPAEADHDEGIEVSGTPGKLSPHRGHLAIDSRM
jgi:hypothetical protein